MIEFLVPVGIGLGMVVFAVGMSYLERKYPGNEDE